MDVRGKRVLVTGATGGLGIAIARRLRGAGADLILTGRRVDAIAELAASLDAEVIPADLTQRDEVDRLLEDAGPVDILIANAGLPGTGLIDQLTVDEIQRALDVNLRVPIVMTRGVVGGMADRGGGHIVFVSSISGKVATPASSIYNATKFGLRGFAFAMRAELRPRGIGVSVILPGPIRDAGMFADTGIKLPRGVGTKSPEAVSSAVLRAIERNRAEIEVAGTAIRLSSWFGHVAPELAAKGNRLVGGEKIALEFPERQADKR